MSKRLWIDMGTPKEVLFFQPIYEEMRRRGYEVEITTRKFRETTDLIRYHGLEASVVGSHGKTREEKLELGIERMRGLLKLFRDWKPDGLVTLANPESTRVAFGLGIPVFNFIDIIESEIVCKLTLPLSKVVFIPFHVPRGEVRRYGVNNIFVYDCLDPVAWMPENPARVDSLGLDRKYLGSSGDLKHPFILYRPAEYRASYFDRYEDITREIIDELKKEVPQAVFYEVPRYKPHRMVALQSLLAYVDLFIGGGGTITEEACWWGTWAVSCRPFETTYDGWLISQGLVHSVSSVEEGVEKCKKLLSQKEKNPTHIKMRSQHFPLKEICDVIEDS